MLSPKALIAALNMSSLGCFIAIIAAIKKVLSPISDTGGESGHFGTIYCQIIMNSQESHCGEGSTKSVCSCECKRWKRKCFLLAANSRTTEEMFT